MLRRKSFLGLSLMAVMLCGSCSREHASHPETNPAAAGPMTRDGRLSPLLRNLGKFSRQVSTSNADAQTYFNQGLVLVYGFNHAEAVRSFDEAARNDPKLGMAYWGKALAVGPNINDNADEPEREQQAYEAAQKAVANRDGMSDVEQALIDAITVRFSHPDGADREQRMEAYADAMERVYTRFSSDPDVSALYAAAVMDTMPWNYYLEDGQPKPQIVKVVAALEQAIELAPDHPGANHYYIHAVEASLDPDRAIPSADKLGSLVPGAGHLVHMPSHIYIRVGRYSDATEANLKAIRADEDYITQCRAQGIYPADYYPHNVHFLTATLAMEGRSREMLEAARKVGAHHGHDMLDVPGFGLPHLLKSIPIFTLVRFGKWDDVLALAEPADSAFVLAVWRYGRGLALTAKGDTAGAAKELVALRSAAAEPELETLTIFDVNHLSSLAAIAVDVLDGEIAAKQGDHGHAIASLRKAVAGEDALLYSEPPDWPIPPRHNLGTVLLESGDAVAAEAVFREDLQRHRNNGWALIGLAKSLEAQGKSAAARQARALFDQSWAKADVKIESARL